MRVVRFLSVALRLSTATMEGQVSNKQYLGDAVYADWDEDHFAVILTTENGYAATNTIVLEAEVLAELENWLKRVLLNRHKETP